MKKLSSITLLGFVFSALLSVNALAQVERDHASIVINASTNAAFAIDLTKTTKVGGDYAVITGPSWLSLTAAGILFGSPSEKEIGHNEIYVSAQYNGKEYLFHFDVMVAAPQASAKYDFKVNANEVFKADLKALSGLEGTYTFTNLPKWVTGLATGVLIGEPKTEDVGTSKVHVTVTNGEQGSSFDVTVSVASLSAPQEGIQVHVGEMIEIDLVRLLNTFGTFRATLPDWMRMGPRAIIRGVPRSFDIGTHDIVVTVANNQGTTQYAFQVEVLP